MTVMVTKHMGKTRRSDGRAGVMSVCPQEHIARSLIKTCDAFKRLIAKRIKDELDITGTQADILMILASESAVLVNDLALLLDANISTVSQALNGMEKRGLISRNRIEEDRRVVCVGLTKAAVGPTHRVIEVTQRMFDHLVSEICKSDVQVLRRSLKKMSDNCRTEPRP